jgi:hypothetical protein
MRAIALTIGMAWLLCCGEARAAGEDARATGCDWASLQHFIIGMENGQRVVSVDARAVSFQMDTTVYSAATGDTRAQRPLPFSEYVIITDLGEPSGGRIRVKDFGNQPIGWVNRTDVLCRRTPLSDSETGLHRRAVIRTAADVQGTPQVKQVYQSLDKRCVGGPSNCMKVSRFTWYFIYLEMRRGEETFYLISEAAGLTHSSFRLLGWLPAPDAINWNTALGLRPSERLPDQKYLCAYETPAELRTGAPPPACKEILGGPRWFSLDVRMAVLKENERENYYNVAFSNAFKDPDAFDPASVFDPLKKVDVFFVIDGTKSMEGVIEGAKRIVTSLKEKTRGKITQGGGTIRFGFRVYRDSIKGKNDDGVENSEHLALPTACDVTNEKEFERAFLNVRAFEPPGDDDYPENMFAGLVQASADMSSCPDHTKVVFVIGDHGYDAEKQKERGYKFYTPAEVASKFKKGLRFHTHPIVFFIQTPSESNNPQKVLPTSKDKYDAAYRLFTKQANELLKLINDGTGIDLRGVQTFTSLPPGSISAAVVASTTERVDDWMRPDVAARFTEAMRAGESLEKIIDRLRADSTLNIPIRYLQFVERSVCDRLGPRCRESVFETVNTAYVKREDTLIPEVLLTKDQLQNWLQILSTFKSGMRRFTREQQVRELIVNALLQDLGTIVQLTIPDTPTEIGKFLQFKGGIPHAANSKLMQYTPEELRSMTKVPPCEIEHLVQYASRKHTMLEMIVNNSGRTVPDYTEERAPAGSCPLSEKGKNIPEIKSDIRPVRLNEQQGGTNYTLQRSSSAGEIVYWIPLRYLP